MTRIEETPLPGVGTRYSFTTEEGAVLGVVHHRSGRRELFLGDPGDPDCVVTSIDLTEGEGHALADVLGGSTVTQHVGDLAHRVEGLTIDWLTLDAGSSLAGATVGDGRVHTRTGAYIVAVIRGGKAIPAPGPETLLEAGDVLLVVGTSQGIESMQALIDGRE